MERSQKEASRRLMAYPLIVEPEAEEDLAAARRWYEERRQGLGVEFLGCVEEAFGHIQEPPQLHAVIYKDVRQTLVRRFPYVVCYTFDGKSVDVLAVFHGHRDPGQWTSRVR